MTRRDVDDGREYGPLYQQPASVYRQRHEGGRFVSDAEWAACVAWLKGYAQRLEEGEHEHAIAG